MSTYLLVLLSDTHIECGVVGFGSVCVFRISTQTLFFFYHSSYKFFRLLLPQKEKEKQPTFLQELKPARMLIGLSLIPAILVYYYFY